MSVLFICYQLKKKEICALLKNRYGTEPKLFSCGMKKAWHRKNKTKKKEVEKEGRGEIRKGRRNAE